MVRYMLTDGNGMYIKKDKDGNYIPVENQAHGEMWTQKLKAKNILLSCINKNLRDRYKVVEVEFGTDVVLVKPEEMSMPNDTVAKQIIDLPIEENNLPNLAADIESFARFVQNAEHRATELSNKLSDVDKEISDIHHYIEFGNFNAYQGWLAFRMLKGRLQQRRKIKDELHILNQLGDCKVGSSALYNVMASVSKLNTRVYQPRMLTELFEKRAQG